jgi:NitT/TauT family transport system ATP-binding protein
MTVVLVTHDIIESLFLSDRIIFMARHPGRVREIIPLDFKQGRDVSTHEQLFALPEYAAYESHIYALMREVRVDSVKAWRARSALPRRRCTI